MTIASKHHFAISLTTIPRRFGSCLQAVLDALSRQSASARILLNIPASYRKWHAPDMPRHLSSVARLELNRPDHDYGPATKLLGALGHLRDDTEVTHVVTVDDDMLLQDPHYLAYLMDYSRILPDCAITIGGIDLTHPPYATTDGLRYRNRFRLVDIPAGYRGVVYPLATLKASPLPFSLQATLPEGIFHDDDAYFGILLSLLGIPLLAVPCKPGPQPTKAPDSGSSGVAERTLAERIDNEATIFRFAVDNGLLFRTKTPENRRRVRRALPRLFLTYLRHLTGTRPPRAESTIPAPPAE
jgi:hypothetical protein